MNLRYGFGVKDATKKLFRRTYVRSMTKHLHGPKRFDLGENEVALVLLGRNIMHSAPYITSYYRSRGVTKFIFLDNGSSDGSERYFSGLPDTIVAQCLLNFRDWQPELRYCAASDYAVGGWRLAVDADELLDFPGSNQLSIPGLAALLANKGFTGMVAQMLEMVPAGSLRAHDGASFADCVEHFRGYTTEFIDKTFYHCPNEPLYFFTSKNIISSSDIFMMRGGLRKYFFEENCLLTKHVLFKDMNTVLPLPHPHITCGLKIADFTSVLYHYKFAGGYLEKEQLLDKQKRLSHGEGRARLRVFNESNDIVFDRAILSWNPSIDDLVNQRFLLRPEIA